MGTCPNHQGLFISLEGPDCVGKTTIIEYLKTHLSLPNYSQVVYTREPGGSRFGEQLRSLLLSSQELALDSITSALLFIASRVDHLNKVIQPALANHGVVIVDRYVDSTAVYQGYLKGVDVHTIYELNRLATGGIMPDLTFYLRAPVQVVCDRSKGRAADCFDLVYLQNLDQMIQGFDYLAHLFPDRIKVIDATLSPDEIGHQIITYILDYVH